MRGRLRKVFVVVGMLALVFLVSCGGGTTGGSLEVPANGGTSPTPAAGAAAPTPTTGKVAPPPPTVLISSPSASGGTTSSAGTTRLQGFVSGEVTVVTFRAAGGQGTATLALPAWSTADIPPRVG